MSELSPQQLCAMRSRANGLHPLLNLLDAVKAVGGINAQAYPAMMLSLRTRVEDLTPAAVTEAIADHKLARSWLMRGTLHMVASDDLRWMIDLLGGAFAAGGKGRRAQLGLDADTSEKGIKALVNILDNGDSLTRSEIVERLAETGIRLDRKTQAPIHLIALAAYQGLVVLGVDRPDGESTYALTDQWVKAEKPIPRDEALERLARRYLEGHAPATVRDFAAWSGLTLTDARKGWSAVEKRGDLVELAVGERTFSVLKGEEKSPRESNTPVVRLLPAFDAYLLGYADRDDIVPPEHRKQVYHGGQTVPVVLVDGVAAGVWRYKKSGKRLNITVEPFDSFDTAVKAGIESEANDIGRFWGVLVSLLITAKRSYSGMLQ